MKKKMKRVLVVDDDEAILWSLKSILESEGYSVETVSTGLGALEKTETESYDLALLDIKHPDIEGTELLSEMHEGVPRMIKIMVTGHASLQNAVEALNLGADAFVMKPVRPEEFLRVIEDKLREQDEAERLSEER